MCENKLKLCSKWRAQSLESATVLSRNISFFAAFGSPGYLGVLIA
jgi:hypothetical protein